jgi:hypothetical protein
MNPILQNVLLFAAAGLAGMLGHYVKAWYRKEIAADLLGYLFRDNPQGTVAAICGVLAATAVAWYSGALDAITLKTLLASGFLTGFGSDSALNKSLTAIPAAPLGSIQTKQGGFIRLGLMLSVAALSACAALGLQPQTLDQTLLEAESTATAALQISTGLLGNHTITLAQDQLVRKSHDVVIAAAHTGHAALAAGDPAKAQAEVDAIRADLAVLQSFVSSHQ